ncbi:hypothetical protein MHU86_24528 [Fragilaria crotonensis]|nr:hypothetical protein MHU86_24528 [Fragilaria crotonensis]
MLVGIAQSKMLIEQRHSFKMNDRVISLHQKKVSAKRMMIDKLKFMIRNTPANDPERMVLMHDLKQLNKALNEAVQNLTRAEEEIVKGDMLVAGTTKDANTFIDLTIGMVLGRMPMQPTTLPHLSRPTGRKEEYFKKAKRRHLQHHVQHPRLLLNRALDLLFLPGHVLPTCHLILLAVPFKERTKLKAPPYQTKMTTMGTPT